MILEISSKYLFDDIEDYVVHLFELNLDSLYIRFKYYDYENIVNKKVTFEEFKKYLNERDLSRDKIEFQCNSTFISFDENDCPWNFINKFQLDNFDYFKINNEISTDLLEFFDLKLLLFIKNHIKNISIDLLDKSFQIYCFKYWILNHFLNYDIIKLILL